jgi:hypothetical protein
MTIYKGVMIVAGAMVLVSLGLAVFFSYDWLWLTAFVGVMLVQGPLTGFCPIATLLRKCGVPTGSTCFVDGACAIEGGAKPEEAKSEEGKSCCCKH